MTTRAVRLIIYLKILIEYSNIRLLQKLFVHFHLEHSYPTNVSITASITLDINVKIAITHIYTVGLGLGYIYLLYFAWEDKTKT